MKAIEVKLDKVFSRYIKLRDTDAQYRGNCFTCYKPLTIEEMQCGHWMKRKKKTVRWFDGNAFGQCNKCNCINDGEYEKMEARMRKEYGDEYVDNLILVGNRMAKFPEDYLIRLSEEYKSRTIMLKQLKILGEKVSKDFYEFNLEELTEFLL